jgi:hypothetical protein
MRGTPPPSNPPNRRGHIPVFDRFNNEVYLTATFFRNQKFTKFILSI